MGKLPPGRATVDSYILPKKIKDLITDIFVENIAGTEEIELYQVTHSKVDVTYQDNLFFSAGVFKMGSLLSQLATGAEIWRDEVGSYARVFGNLYGKMAKNIGFQKSVISFFQHWGPLKPPFLVLWQYLSNIYKITEGLLKILIFWLFTAIYIPNAGRFFNFWQKIDPKVAIKSLKIKIFKIPSVIL